MQAPTPKKSRFPGHLTMVVYCPSCGRWQTVHLLALRDGRVDLAAKPMIACESCGRLAPTTAWRAPRLYDYVA